MNHMKFNIIMGWKISEKSKTRLKQKLAFIEDCLQAMDFPNCFEIEWTWINASTCLTASSWFLSSFKLLLMAFRLFLVRFDTEISNKNAPNPSVARHEMKHKWYHDTTYSRGPAIIYPMGCFTLNGNLRFQIIHYYKMSTLIVNLNWITTMGWVVPKHHHFPTRRW